MTEIDPSASSAWSSSRLRKGFPPAPARNERSWGSGSTAQHGCGQSLGFGHRKAPSSIRDAPATVSSLMSRGRPDGIRPGRTASSHPTGDESSRCERACTAQMVVGSAHCRSSSEITSGVSRERNSSSSANSSTSQNRWSPGRSRALRRCRSRTGRSPLLSADSSGASGAMASISSARPAASSIPASRPSCPASAGTCSCRSPANLRQGSRLHNPPGGHALGWPPLPARPYVPGAAMRSWLSPCHSSKQPQTASLARSLGPPCCHVVRTVPGLEPP